MATPAQIQAQLDAAGTGNVCNILQSQRVDGTFDEHYAISLNSPYPGRARWVRTTSANTAAQQAASILAGIAL